MQLILLAAFLCTLLTRHDAFVLKKNVLLIPPQGKTIEKSNSIESVQQLRAGALLETFPVHDAAISLLVAVESFVWLKLWTTLAARGILDSKITRKIIHTGSAPLFMAHWPLYSHAPEARYLAAAVPLLSVARLIRAGLKSDDSAQGGSGKASELVQAVSRTGDKGEALGGPLLYSIVLLLGTLVFFRDSPVGVVAVAQMAAGDGLADIFGSKSVVGSVAFVVGGFVVTTALLWLLSATGVLALNVMEKLPAILAISLLSAATELFPGVDDNISVPIVAAVAAALLLR